MPNLLIGGALVFVASCGEAEKPKLELDSDLGKTLDAYHTAAGAHWTDVEAVESAHPYVNSFQREWTVRGRAEVTEMRVVFERFETERGYDTVVVAGQGGEPQRFTGSLTGNELVITGNEVRIRFNSDSSVTGWGFRLLVQERDPGGCVCPANYDPMCGVDGRTYSNGCAASCAGVGIAFAGDCNGDPWTRVSRTVESAHPYANNFRNTWTVREGSGRFIRAHFGRIDLERGYDFIKVYDGRDQLVATYTGQSADVTTPAVEGDTLKIEMSTDSSVTKWGFVLDGYDVIGGCRSDADCDGGVCTQIQCIRAPCFNVCEARDTVRDVSLEDLVANPTAYQDQHIRVVAEPQANLACTRRACSQANPCCNRCSGAFALGNGAVQLRSESGETYGCSGNECTQTCQPAFDRPEAGRYQFEGRVRIDQGSTLLFVQSYRAVDCHAGGCSGQLCSNVDRISTCEWREEYACYRTASCAAQADGLCAWTQTPELQACLDGQRTMSFPSTDTPLAIPDNNTNGATSVITVNGNAMVERVRVSVNADHSYRGDLVVTLVAPNGRRAVLTNRQGGSQDDFIVEHLEVNGLGGQPMAGRWQLLIQDLARADTGSLTNWTLELN